MKHLYHRYLYVVLICCSLRAMENGETKTPAGQLPATQDHRNARSHECLPCTYDRKSGALQSVSERPPTPIPPCAAALYLMNTCCQSSMNMARPGSALSRSSAESPVSRRSQLLARGIAERPKSSKDPLSQPEKREGEENIVDRSHPNLRRHSSILARAASSSGSNPDLLALLFNEEQKPGPECWPHKK